MRPHLALLPICYRAGTGRRRDTHMFRSSNIRVRRDSEEIGASVDQSALRFGTETLMRPCHTGRHPILILPSAAARRRSAKAARNEKREPMTVKSHHLPVGLAPARGTRVKASVPRQRYMRPVAPRRVNRFTEDDPNVGKKLRTPIMWAFLTASMAIAYTAAVLAGIGLFQ